jgi:two-component system, chemotaxis family, protein-glutamate methylesterase/glutaminase
MSGERAGVGGGRADGRRERPAAADIRAVAIGASAGGVEALSELLPALRADSRAAVFVVLHLPRDRPSLLVEVFSRKCALEVREAADKEPVAPGTVYFAPPNYHLLVDAGPQLALSADELVNHSRPSIDVLFDSAAEVYREHLLGIILTGANEDGAAGLAAVHDAGGLTVVQEPGTAQSSAMIRSALERRPVDLVLDLEGIADLLNGMCAGEPRRRT